MKIFIFISTLSILLFSASVLADITVLDEHFPDDPLVRGWSTSGYDLFTWQSGEGNAGAMWTQLNHGPGGPYDTELVSEQFSTTGATDGSLTFNYEKDIRDVSDQILRFYYRTGGSRSWIEIWNSGSGQKDWPTAVNIDLGITAPGMLGQSVVELRWYYTISGGFFPIYTDITIDDVVVTIPDSTTPTSTPTTTPTNTPTPSPTITPTMTPTDTPTTTPTETPTPEPPPVPAQNKYGLALLILMISVIIGIFRQNTDINPSKEQS